MQHQNVKVEQITEWNELTHITKVLHIIFQNY